MTPGGRGPLWSPPAAVHMRETHNAIPLMVPTPPVMVASMRVESGALP